MMHNQKSLSYKQMAGLLAMLVAVMPFSIDAYLPSLPQIAQSLNADIHHIERSVSTFIFGVAFGQILGGSLSDIKGRRNIALIGLMIYLIGCVSLMFVQTANELLLLRIVQALGAGMSAVVVGAIVRDNFKGKDAAQMFALIGIILMCAPLVAPMVGSFLQMLGGWRLVFVFLLVYASVVWVLLFRFLPKQRAEPITRAQLGQIGARYWRVLTNKSAMGFLFFQAGSFSSLMAFLTESPFVYMQKYTLTSMNYAWLFMGNVITMMLCNRLTAFGLRRQWNSVQLLLLGIGLQMVANTILVGEVLLLGQPPLFGFIPFVMLSVGTQGFIVANTQALFMSQNAAEIAGSANAVLLAGQSLIGASVGLLVTLLHNGTILVMVGTMFVSTAVGIALLWHFSKDVLRKGQA